MRQVCWSEEAGPRARAGLRSEGAGLMRRGSDEVRVVSGPLARCRPAGGGYGRIRGVPLSPAAARPLGLALGLLADAVFADPRRGHPVAGFGRAAGALERRIYRDSVRRGAVFAAVTVTGPVLAGAVVQRAVRGGPCWPRRRRRR